MPKCVCKHRWVDHDQEGTCIASRFGEPCGCERYRPARSSVLRSPVARKADRSGWCTCDHPQPLHAADGACLAIPPCGCHGFTDKRSRKSAPARTKRKLMPKCRHCACKSRSHLDGLEFRPCACGVCPGYAPARGIRQKRRTPLAAMRRTLWDLFRAYVYERDGDACISCGKAGLVGSDRQAGHLFNAGASSLIRWHPKNVHVQCYRCNVGLRGNVAPYAVEFICRYGGDELQRLGRLSKVVKKWTAPEVSDLIAAMKRGAADYEAFFAEHYEL